MATATGSDTRAVGWPPAAPRYWARAPGDAEDLAIDYAAPRPQTVTQILARCVRDATGAPCSIADIWQWTVPQRTQALLAVARAADIEAVTALAQCVRDSCAERIELELELESFAVPAETRLCTVRSDSAELALRLPTGEDQRRWLASPAHDAGALPTMMGTSLVHEIDGAPPASSWRLPEAWLPDVEKALAAHDATTDLVLDVSCPRCGVALAVEVDVEALLIERLARAQQALLCEVHLFASRYHWSESQVLDVPAWRRAHYLAMLRPRD